MSENALHLKFKSCVHQFTVHFFRTSFFAFPFPGCAVRASSSSPPGVVCFPWRFVCLALGDSSSALRTCSSILLFHCRGIICVYKNNMSDCMIMVRTRGLGRALGRVIGRTLGREDHHRSPTTSSSRQREAAPIVEDDHVLPEDVRARVVEVVHNAEGFLGGPRDPSVLTDYGDHVAVIERPELKLSSHGRKVQKFGRPAPEIEGLIACSVDIGDRGLISAFVERWHKETSNFHLPVGELTITLDDMAYLLHLPIIGAFHGFEPLHVDEVILMFVELLEVSGEEARAETTQCHRAYTVVARAYLLHLLGCTIFANKSATHVHVVFLDAFRDLSHSGSYAWGVVVLVHMYDHLIDACKSDDRQLAGYITLLQVIYDGVLLWSDTDQREWCSNLDMFRAFLHRLRLPCYHLKILMIGGCITLTILQQQGKFVLCPNSDDTYLEPHIPKVPEASAAASAHAPSDAEQPRHAMEACQAIAERLECLLNLRIVTACTKIHEVMEDYIRIARGVTPDGNVYVRS
ncbi:Protein MAIN-LIKE 1 [Glycine max]|nr:Protein MAIN-LIKE 1 [Glycine max]